MQNDTSSNMADKVVDSLSGFFEKRAGGFCIEDINEDKNHKTFTVIFRLYEFYWLGITYESGRVTSYIIQGKNIIRLRNLCTWWEKFDLNEWLRELDVEIRLRIPDKYLEAKGYL